MALVVALALPAVTLTAMLGGIAVFCCDADSPGPAGMMHRFFATQLPGAVGACVGALPGGPRVVAACSGGVDYLMNKPHPLLAAFYLTLVVGGFAGYLVVGAPHVPNPRVGPEHVFLPFILVYIVLYTFYLSCRTSPGLVTKSNFERLEEIYPYDGFIFVRGRTCQTCGTPRVARSKHCRMLGVCVEKYDHYCPWINNTVGARNLRFFLLFLLATAVFLLYGAYVLANLLLWFVERDRLWEVKFVHSQTKAVVDADWRIVTQYMLSNNGFLIFIFILCVIMGITIAAFFLYQLYNAACSTTTSESIKWGVVNDFYDSARWKRIVELREAERADGKEVVDDKARLENQQKPLEERTVEFFPSVKPVNIYDTGSYVKNVRLAFFPPSLRVKAVATTNPATTTNTTTTATTNTTNKKKRR